MNSIREISFERMLLVLTWLGLIVFLLFVFIRPSFVGFGIENADDTLKKCQDDLMQTQSEISVCKINNSACNILNNQISAEKEKLSVDYSECREELELTKLNLTLSMRKLEISNGELNETQKTLDKLNSDYSTLAENLANNLCCKNKIDNPAINYYSIESNKIICLENGNFRLSC